MANEATFNYSLNLRKTDGGSLVLLNEPYKSSFRFDITGTAGPTPGRVVATTAGVDVDLSSLTVPGACVIKNRDDENFVTVGIREPATSMFYPLMEVGPGEEWPLKLSRYVGEEFSGTGTGTAGGAANYLHLKANTASCECSVEAYER